MSVSLFTQNNLTGKWIFIKFDSIVVLLKCDFAIFFNWTAVCISAHIARVMQEIFIGEKKVAGKNETHILCEAPCFCMSCGFQVN